MERKLTKSNDRKICGVCGGIAEYLDIDPTVVRVLTAIAILNMVFIIFFYFVAAAIMPSKQNY